MMATQQWKYHGNMDRDNTCPAKDSHAFEALILGPSRIGTVMMSER